MRTIYTIIFGICIFFIMRTSGHYFSHLRGQKLMSLLFIPFWCIAMIWNMYHGMQQGYTFLEEIGFFALNFGIPSLLAAYLVFKK